MVGLGRTARDHWSKYFDLQLAATMLENDIYRIYTYNRADFSFLPHLEVLTPRE